METIHLTFINLAIAGLLTMQLSLRGHRAKNWSHDSLEVPIRGPGPCLVSRSRISSAFCTPPCGNAIRISNDGEGLGTQGACSLMIDYHAPSLEQYQISAVMCKLAILPNQFQAATKKLSFRQAISSGKPTV